MKPVYAVIFTVLLRVLCFPGHAQVYSINWYKVSGGGGTSTNGAYLLSGTIGQHDAGAMAGGSFTLAGGFWVIPGLVQTPGSPQLIIERAAPGFATISWTPANSPGFVLQYTESLSPTNWLNAASGATNSITVPATFPQRYYRMIRP